MKDINIFEIVPENFFVPLSSPNKALYMKIISLIYKLVQNGLSYGIEKEILVDEIEYYLGSIKYDIIKEEDEQQCTNNRERAGALIRKLIDCGWIYPEATNNYKQIINFQDYAIVILESFLKIVNKESLEYQGNIISIYSMLYSNEKAGIVIRHAFENTKGIISGLKTLNANIKKYMDRLTKQKTPEEEFKEHFLSKIQENINTARTEFKGLNNGLKGVKFGNEEYEFKIEKSKENKEYYDMIMHNENIGEGFTLFSTSFENKHKELLNELFDKLTLDNESNEAELIKLTDYRNYMSYDIQIKYHDGMTSLFSKVCKEKSGGETQTPFYVAMAASFLQLYRGISLSSESIGLILFDEAFDKMDDARIMSMMEFYKKLNLQLIIAAPPQKIESITPYVNTVLLAIKADKFSIIEDMINEEL